MIYTRYDNALYRWYKQYVRTYEYRWFIFFNNSSIQGGSKNRNPQEQVSADFTISNTDFCEAIITSTEVSKAPTRVFQTTTWPCLSLAEPDGRDKDSDHLPQISGLRFTQTLSLGGRVQPRPCSISTIVIDGTRSHDRSLWSTPLNSHAHAPAYLEVLPRRGAHSLPWLLAWRS